MSAGRYPGKAPFFKDHQLSMFIKEGKISSILLGSGRKMRIMGKMIKIKEIKPAIHQERSTRP